MTATSATTSVYRSAPAAAASGSALTTNKAPAPSATPTAVISCVGLLAVALGLGLALGGGPERGLFLALDLYVAQGRCFHCHGRARDGRKSAGVGGAGEAVPTAAAPTTRAAAARSRRSSAGREHRQRLATSILAPSAVAPLPLRPRAWRTWRARTPPTWRDEPTQCRPGASWQWAVPPKGAETTEDSEGGPARPWRRGGTSSKSGDEYAAPPCDLISRPSCKPSDTPSLDETKADAPTGTGTPQGRWRRLSWRSARACTQCKYSSGRAAAWPWWCHEPGAHGLAAACRRERPCQQA